MHFTIMTMRLLQVKELNQEVELKKQGLGYRLELFG